MRNKECLVAEVTVSKGRMLMNTELKIIYDKEQIKATKTIKAAVLAVNRKTHTDIPGYIFTWFLNDKKIGEGREVVKENFPTEGVTVYKLKVIAKLENVGSIVRTITITMKRGELGLMKEEHLNFLKVLCLLNNFTVNLIHEYTRTYISPTYFSTLSFCS